MRKSFASTQQIHLSILTLSFFFSSMWSHSHIVSKKKKIYIKKWRPGQWQSSHKTNTINILFHHSKQACNIKGELKHWCMLAWKHNMSKYFHLRPSFGCSVDIYTQEVIVLNLSSSKHRERLVYNWPMKSRKMLAHDIFGSFATHTGLVHATHCWAYNDSNHSCIFAIFKRQSLTLRTTNKLLCVF